MGMVKSLFALATAAVAASVHAGMVHELSEVHVAHGATPQAAFTVVPVSLSEHALHNAAADGESMDASNYEGLSAEVGLAWDGAALHAIVRHGARPVSGDVVVVCGDRVARRALEPCGGDFLMADVPWSALSNDGSPPEDPTAVFDLAWDGLDAPTLRAMPADVRRTWVHTSTAALCAKPAWRANSHLARAEQWGVARFMDGQAVSGRHDFRDGFLHDFTDMPCLAGSRTVNGDLSDWPAAGFSRAAILPAALGDRYAADFAAAFDADYLYVAAKVSRPDGCLSNTAAAATGAGYNGGDALQIRIAPEGFSPKSFCAWMSPTGPALAIDTGKPSERDLLARGGRIAFGPAAGGCAIEIAIPWDAVGAKARAGDEWRMTFQPWWNATTGRFAFFAPLVLESPVAKTVEADVPREGAVSLGVFDRDGRLVRTLLKADWRKNGAISEPWDLKDQRGEFVAPGKYALRGLVTQGVSAEYRRSVCNPGTPPWPTADGTGDWLSDEAPPQAVATDGVNFFIAAPGSEKGFAVIAIGPDGRRIWGVGEQFFPRCVSLSYLDGVLHALFSGPVKDAKPGAKMRPDNAKDWARGRAVLVSYDAKSGRRVGFSARNPRMELGERWPYREEASLLCDHIAAKDFAPSNYIGQPRYFASGVGETDNAIGFAALPGIFAVSKFYENKIEFYDAATLEKAGEVAVEAPAGLCATRDGALLAISGKTVVKIALPRGASRVPRPVSSPVPVVVSGLSAPVALCVDRAGIIYVSDWAGEMRVKKFAPDGSFLGAVGKAGGRPWIGAFEKDGMLLPHGLAVSDAGVLLVAEADTLPKRVSAWNSSTGAFIRHWIGPAPYGGMSGFWFDPGEPGFFHAMGCKFSWKPESGAWDVVATDCRRTDRDQAFATDGADCMATGSRIVRRGGKTFLCTGSRNHTVWLRRDGDRFVPCAAVGGLQSTMTDDGTGVNCWDSNVGRHLYRNVRPECFRGHSGKRGRGGDNYAWSDLDGDGTVSPDELTWCETLTRGDSLDTLRDGVLQCEFHTGWGAMPAPDGTLHFSGFAKDGDCIWRIAPERWTEFGPVYDIASARPVRREPGVAKQFSGVWTTTDGNVFAVGALNQRGVTARSSVFAFRPDGSVRWEWAAPKSRDEKDVAASGVSGEWEIPGIGRVLCAWNWWWNYRPYFFTDDGLYVGTFGEKTSLGPSALWGESATYFFQTADGRPFLVNGANQAAHVFEIRGLDGAERFGGTVCVTEAELAAAKAGAEAAGGRARTSRRREPEAPIRLDGTPVAMDGGDGRAWRIALSAPFGSGTLHVEADVDDATPMLQTGTDFRTLFVTGDCVDLMIATDPDAPKGRRHAAAGDRRVLFSELDGRGAAILYEPVSIPRAARPERLMAAEIDRIVPLENANVAISRRADGSGYRLVADVPLSDIGLDPCSGRTLLGDVGVVFSGASGGRELRLYRYNRDTSMTSDLTTEATLQPHEWGKILRPRGVNLIEDPTFGAGAAPFLAETTNHFTVGQTVRLPPGTGRTAQLRLLMRAEGLHPENRKVEGKPGAWMAVWAFFKDAAGKVLSQGVVYRRETDVHDWTPCVRDARHDSLDSDDAILLQVPDGAETVRISFKLTTRGQSVPARVWIDGAEFSVSRQ